VYDQSKQCRIAEPWIFFKGSVLPLDATAFSVSTATEVKLLVIKQVSTIQAAKIKHVNFFFKTFTPKLPILNYGITRYLILSLTVLLTVLDL
jgi:hypothetical protein